MGAIHDKFCEEFGIGSGEAIDYDGDLWRGFFAGVAYRLQNHLIVPVKASKAMIQAAEDTSDLYRMGKPELWGQVYYNMICAAE